MRAFNASRLRDLKSRFGGRKFLLLLTLTCAASLAGLLAEPRAFAHGGQIEVGGGAKGPVTLSAAQEKAIGLQTVAADFRTIAEYLDLNGEVRLVPERQQAVSSRISGQVTALYAHLGDNVKKGQRLLRVQARLVGDPPPSVDIVAPMSGVVDSVTVTLGQSVEPAAVLYTISDRSQIDVVAKVYEEDVSKVRVGQAVHVHALSYPDKTFAGKVTLIGPNLDPQSRTLEVWIRLGNPGGLLKPNLFARASLVLSENTSALAIPRAAIIAANGEKFVFVHEGKQFHRVEVTVGASDDDWSEITDGLVPGDEVVTQGNRQVYTQWLTGGKPMPGGDDD